MYGIIKNIYISETSAQPLHEIQQAQLDKDKGICGDRYHSRQGKWSDNDNKPDFNLSLIEYENILRFKQQGIELKPSDYRRNIVTQGINLNDLVGKRFLIGTALCLGIRLCEPCRYLEELTSLTLVKTMVNKGGLRAQILADGIINLGDAITTSDQLITLKPDEVEDLHS